MMENKNWNLTDEQAKEFINGEAEEKINPKWSKPTTEVLKNRLDNLVMLFNKIKEYPFRARVLGFNTLYIPDAEDIKSRIRELCDILNIEATTCAELENGCKIWREL